MSNKIKQIAKHLFYILWSNVLYGLILYFVFTWLAGYSLLYAYFWNFTLIILGLSIDAYFLKMLQSKKILTQLKEGKDAEINYRLIQWLVDSFVSFKTILYLFYIIILIISQIIDVNSTFLDESISNFILANNYSILFLVAFDMLLTQFSKDKERMKKISENLKKSLAENKEEKQNIVDVKGPH